MQSRIPSPPKEEIEYLPSVTHACIWKERFRFSPTYLFTRQNYELSSTPAPNDAIAQLADILSEKDARDLVQTFFKEYDGLLLKLASGAEKISILRHTGLASLAQRFSVLEMSLVKLDGTVGSNDIAIISAEYERGVLPLRKYIQRHTGHLPKYSSSGDDDSS